MVREKITKTIRRVSSSFCSHISKSKFFMHTPYSSLEGKPVGKRGMSVNEIFVYSLSLFVVAFILIYGYSIINDFVGRSSSVEMLQFQKNLEGMVKSYSSEFGSTGFREIPAPGNVVVLCFTNYYAHPDESLNACSNTVVSDHPVIRDSFDGGNLGLREEKNVFLLSPRDEVIGSYFVGNVSLGTDCNFNCIASHRGRFHVRLEGRGNHVVLTDATPAS